MIIQHQDNVAGFAGAHTYWWLPQQILRGSIAVHIESVFTSVGKIFLFTASEWASVVLFHVEATYRATTGTVRIRLFDLTAAAAVVSSEVSTASSTLARARSSAITLVDGHEYRLQVGVDSGAAGAIVGASILGTIT